MWNNYIYWAIPAILLFISSSILIFVPRKAKIVELFMMTGILVVTSFIIILWISQKHPPLRTMGDTRLWYSFFLSAIGYIAYKRWKYKWLLSFSCVVSCVFIIVNLCKPELHSTYLMPALRSHWFIPHVTFYILAYALMVAATVSAIVQLIKLRKGKEDLELSLVIDRIVYQGFALLTIGLLIGIVWAIQAWGHSWNWDTKETWALITYVAYTVYIHLRLQNRYTRLTMWILPVAFLLLMITWLGVDYLPTASNSMHIYSK
ncbi:cytochrome c biogenesis protein CcsA [Dysgonomonas sp. GY617]|uniref:cytochrome c biogenesis protein CcsA n=1 Tax=Dysgonomonas sp. GY617 TaxID=2780420 RepID=UPI0018EFAE31|nr:cytochrome c biogenesis protein CcsA [Dysgonomonas sp. GY617]